MPSHGCLPPERLELQSGRWLQTRNPHPAVISSCGCLVSTGRTRLTVNYDSRDSARASVRVSVVCYDSSCGAVIVAKASVPCLRGMRESSGVESMPGMTHPNFKDKGVESCACTRPVIGDCVSAPPQGSSDRCYHIQFERNRRPLRLSSHRKLSSMSTRRMCLAA